MKKCFTFSSLTFLLTVFGLLSPANGQWKKYIIDDSLTTAEIIRVADINCDTKPDIVTADYYEDKVLWYENNKSGWTRHTIDRELEGPSCPYVADIDNDGILDVVVTGFDSNVIVWYENNHPSWPKHVVADSTGNGTFINAADIDGDGDLDIVTSQWSYNGDVIWYENDHLNWKKHIISSNWGAVTSLQVADIDGDNAMDVAVVGRLEYKVSWFRNGNSGLTWKENVIDYDLDGAYHLSIADLNGDDNLDVVATGYYIETVAWYENNLPGWKKHPVDLNLKGAKAVGVADIDSDEKPDIVATGKYAHDVVWYKNNYPDPWVKQIIDKNLHFANHIIAADIDGDNISDIVATGQQSPGTIVWYENLANKIYPKSVELSHKYLPPSGDILSVKAEFNNPHGHPLTSYAAIYGEEQAFQDSLKLFDDGMHSDNDLSDNIGRGTILLKDLEEDMYVVDLSIADPITDTTYQFPFETRFTTAGPIEIISFEQKVINEHLIGLADFKLKNYGTQKTIKNVSAKLVASDTCVTGYGRNNTYFGSIEPGETKNVEIAFGIKVSDIQNDIYFDLEISSDDIVYWIDSLKVDLVTGTKDELVNLPMQCVLEQNYPNPFNPTTKIQYSIPVNSKKYVVGSRNIQSFNQPITKSTGDLVLVQLIVYNILGREVATLVNGQQRPGQYEVRWDAAAQASGIYFYKLRAGEFTETKKMVLLR